MAFILCKIKPSLFCLEKNCSGSLSRAHSRCDSLCMYQPFNMNFAASNGGEALQIDLN